MSDGDCVFDVTTTRTKSRFLGNGSTKYNRLTEDLNMGFTEEEKIKQINEPFSPSLSHPYDSYLTKNTIGLTNLEFDDNIVNSSRKKRSFVCR